MANTVQTFTIKNTFEVDASKAFVELNKVAAVLEKMKAMKMWLTFDTSAVTNVKSQITSITKEADKLKTATKSVWDSLKSTVAPSASPFTNFFNKIKDSADALRNKLVWWAWVKDAFDKLKSLAIWAWALNTAKNIGWEILWAAVDFSRWQWQLETAFGWDKAGARRVSAAALKQERDFGISSTQSMDLARRIGATESSPGVRRTADETIKLMTDWNKLLALQGVSGERADRATEQYLQIISKGKAEMQDMKIIAENGVILPWLTKDAEWMKQVSIEIAAAQDRKLKLQWEQIAQEKVMAWYVTKSSVAYKQEQRELDDINRKIKDETYNMQLLNDKKQSMNGDGLTRTAWDMSKNVASTFEAQGWDKALEEKTNRIETLIARVNAVKKQFLLQMAGVDIESGEITKWGLIERITIGLKSLMTWMDENKETMAVWWKQIWDTIGNLIDWVVSAAKWLAANQWVIKLAWWILAWFLTLQAIASIASAVSAIAGFVALWPTAAIITGIAVAISLLAPAIAKFAADGWFDRMWESMKKWWWYVTSWFDDKKKEITNLFSWWAWTDEKTKTLWKLIYTAISPLWWIANEIGWDFMWKMFDWMLVKLKQIDFKKIWTWVKEILSFVTNPLKEVWEMFGWIVATLAPVYNYNYEIKVDGNMFATNDNMDKLVVSLDDAVKRASYKWVKLGWLASVQA